jgi:hypothetical protein
MSRQCKRCSQNAGDFQKHNLQAPERQISEHLNYTTMFHQITRQVG